MRLIFSILWFDDTKEFFESLDIDWLRREISLWGFFPDIKLVTTPDEFAEYSPYQKFDIIVVDRNLEEYGEGQDFIANLRNNSIYTEVIFYTAGSGSDLWDAVRAKQLEGVFISNRNSILSKISQVGRQSIRKVLDLENMRGIVMAEVGELDHMLSEIITRGLPSLSDGLRKSIFTRFHEEAMKEHDQRSTRLTNFLDSPEIIEMLDLCDSDKRWQNFNRLRKSHEKLMRKAKLGDYSGEVLKPRNFLAHGRPESQEDGGYLFRYQGKEYAFNDEVSFNLRQTILGYKMAFSEILQILEV